MAVNYKGAKCMICGYSKCLQALEFHHVNSSEKDFSVSNKGYTRSWKKVKEEIDKCALVCANCHREIHAGLRKINIPRWRNGSAVGCEISQPLAETPK